MKKLTIGLFTLILSIITNAQTITDVLNDTLNFYEKVGLIEQNNRDVFNSSELFEQKRYGRWYQFWSRRVDTLGGFTAYPLLVMD